MPPGARDPLRVVEHVEQRLEPVECDCELAHLQMLLALVVGALSLDRVDLARLPRRDDEREKPWA